MPAIIDKVLRAGEGKIQRKLHRLTEQVNSIEKEYEALSDAELRELTAEFKQRYADGDSLDDLLPEAFGAAGRRRSGPWASAPSMCSSWAEPPCISATSPR